MNKLKLVKNSNFDYCYESDEHYYQGTVLAIRMGNIFKLYRVVSAGEFLVRDYDDKNDKYIEYNEPLFTSTEYIEDFEYDPDFTLEYNLNILEHRIRSILK